MATAFNGSSAFLTNTSNSAVTQLPVTFFARVYIGATKQARIFDISTGTTANDVIGIQQSNSEIRAQHYDGTSEGYAGINNAGNIGRWITVAAVFDGLASRAIYVDGGAQSSTNATSVVAPSGINRVTIGYAPWGSNEYFNGTVSHALLFASALTAAEIMALHLDTLQVLAPRRTWVPVSAGGSSLDLTETTGVSLAGTVAASGDIQIGTNFNLTQSSAVGLTGSLATTGDVQIGTTFNLAQTANVGLTSSVGVSGDIQILAGSLDLTQTSAVALSGTVGLSGDIQIGTSFNLAQTAAVGLTGSVGTTGNIQIGTSFNLAQSVALAMSGSVAVTGDFQSGTAPVITQSFGNFGWDPRKRLSWKRHELREELEAALDDAPKAVQELVRVPGPEVSEVPVREALEVVRKARRSKERLVLRREIDELHEAVETVATFVKEREAARQARRRKQQHLLLLS